MTSSSLVIIVIIIAVVVVVVVARRWRVRRPSSPPGSPSLPSSTPLIDDTCAVTSPPEPVSVAVVGVEESLPVPVFVVAAADASLPEPPPALESSSQEEPPSSWTPRTGNGGLYAEALVLFDRAHQWFARSMSEPYVVADFSECASDVEHNDYFITLLVQLSDHGATTYTTSSDDHVVVSSFEAWLDLFGTNILDVFSVRCSTLLERGDAGDAYAQAVGAIYLEVLRTLIPEALAVVGYAPVAVFPWCGLKPATETMRVVGHAAKPARAGEIIGVRQYGLMKGRKLVRQAHVTVG